MKRIFGLIFLVVIIALSLSACGRRERTPRWEPTPEQPIPTAAAAAPTSTPAPVLEADPTDLPAQGTSTAAPTETAQVEPTQDPSSDPVIQELIDLLKHLESENAQGDAFGDLP